MKSKHIYRNMEIPYEELKYFVEPQKVNMLITYKDLPNILDKNMDNNGVINYIANVFIDLLNHMPNLKQYERHSIACITYNSHLTGYDFRFNPIDIVNMIYRCLELDYRIPFINLDTDMGMDYLKEYIKSYNKDIRRQKPNIEILSIINELDYNVDRICSLYNDNLEAKIKNHILPKDALFYIAYKYLRVYEITKDPKYFVIPAEYYTYVSHMQTSYYPHKILFKGSRIWFEDFRKKYNEIEEPPSKEEFDEFILPEEEILIAYDILKPGMVEREIRDVVHRAQANPDYKKYQKLFEMKMNFYMNSNYVKYIKGLYGLLGYVGFSYNNEYLVFDKFHNSETKDDTKRTILTHGEAIYALPSDRFSILSKDKQQVNEARKTDDRIKKMNHTINGSFLNRLDNVVNGDNVSTTTLEEELKKQQGKILIKR